MRAEGVDQRDSYELIKAMSKVKKTDTQTKEQLQMQQLAAQQQAAMEQQLALRQAQQGLPGGTAQAVMQQAQADAASDIQQTGAVTA